MELLKKILNEAARAPSADNLQPWEFNLLSNTSFEIVPKNVGVDDHFYFNYKDRLTQIAIGALLQNIKVVAAKHGYASNFSYKNWELGEVYVFVDLIKSDKEDSSLYEAVQKRATLRVPYSREVDLELFEKIKFPNVSIHTDRDIVKQLASDATINEQLVLTNKDLHTTFKKHITWSKKEEETKKSGLLIDTMGLNPVQKIAFQSIRWWGVLKRLNQIGFSKVIAKENAAMYESSAAMGIVSVASFTPEEVVHGGMIFQKTWLTFIKNDYWLQPVTGITFLCQMHREKSLSWIDKSFLKHAERICPFLQTLVPKETYPLLLFRVGKSNKKPVYTRRKEIS